jgi:hypothetical protein
MTRAIIVIAAGLALTVTLPAVSAQAQSPRTFVSAAGNDSNPCSFAAPCRHFQAAVNATSAGGEVDALDPAGYGPITISHAITIEGQGWSYIAPPAGGNAMTINAGASDTIVIHGVSLDGAGITGLNGINFTNGKELNIRDCQIRNFTGDGIFFGPDGSHNLSMSNTVVANNGVNGVSIGPTGSGTVNVVLDHVELDNNAHNGVAVFGNGTGVVRLILSNSVSSHNDTGVLDSSNTATTAVMVQSSIIAANGNGLRATGSGAVIVVTRSTITANTLGVPDDTGATLTSGDNLVIVNSIDGSFSASNPLR